jgi:hypothetical protein
MPDSEEMRMQLYAFVKRPMAFRCRPPGRNPSPERFIARVVHMLSSPPTPAEDAQLDALLPASAQALKDFYRKHNGFLLYRDTISDAAGIQGFTIKAWDAATSRLHDQAQDCLEDEADSRGLLSTVVFGTAPRSGNYFIIQTAGPSAGAIFYSDHETYSIELFASNFDEFLLRVMKDPVTLIVKDLGCFARYSDGSTRTQWIPEEVVEGGE